MSGTSLDGLDIACCGFSKREVWEYRIVAATTIQYEAEWLTVLKNAHLFSAEELLTQHARFGKFLGEHVAKFLQQQKFAADFVSSHGHTVFHQPSRGFSFQLGEGSSIAAACGLPVVCDFRNGDIALGGQGAPLVPVGDQILFSSYDFCLNLGGIANISLTKGGRRIAFDMCACNQVLNMLANTKGKEYDHNGELAARGKADEQLLDKLNDLSFYRSAPPKSLGREDVERDILPLINEREISTEDKLRTFCDHVAIQISRAIPENKNSQRLLVTGGGAMNDFLISRIRSALTCKVEIPDPMIVQFKEALIFAFLGVLRWRNETNCLASVTGARSDSSTGAVFFVPK